MTIADCLRGDLVAIVWPEGPVEGGEFSDRALSGREVLVEYGGPANTVKAKKHVTASAVHVTVCDWETLEPSKRTDAWRCIKNVEVLAVVESRYTRVDEGVERALGREGDVNDPMLGR